MTQRINNPDTNADIELREYLVAGKRGCFVMVAGAGSGKTTSLVKALYHIGTTVGLEMRKVGRQVACITYTEVAVGEIWGDVGNQNLYHVSTIHSFLWSLVSSFQSDISEWVQKRAEEKLAELQDERANFSARVQQKTRDRNQRSIDRLQLQIPRISAVKSFTYGTGSNYLEGILGHDDILRMVPQLIQQKPLFASIIAQKYPFVFVDESQDTVPDVVESLRFVARRNVGNFSLGFFGDPMQKVYMSGTGEIALDEGWRKIEKPENFRCPTKVLRVVNAIRAKGDGLQQTRGRHERTNGVEQPVIGTARFFIMPADNERPASLNRVRAWLAMTDSDAEWTNDSKDSGVRILVIEHRMAAIRLGFERLHAAFRDGAPDNLASAFRDGSAWPLRPFQDVLLPLAAAASNGLDFEAMSLLREHSERVSARYLKDSEKPGRVLAELKEDVQSLTQMLAPTCTCTVLDVLQFASVKKLVALDERLTDYIDPQGKKKTTQQNPTLDSAEDAENAQKVDAAIVNYFACPARELPAYDEYRRALSRYSTQQGVKGAEFERVIVVLDDDESNQFLFSYDKLLGLKAPSKTDLQNQSNGQESVFERTRRLLYVCCSRATRDLAVVLYTENVNEAARVIRQSTLFDRDDVLTPDLLK